MEFEHEPLKPHEIAVGAFLLVGAFAAGWHLVTHPEAHAIYSWAFVGVAGFAGLYVLVPYRTKYFWREVRSAAPFLNDPPPLEEDDADGA